VEEAAIGTVGVVFRFVLLVAIGVGLLTIGFAGFAIGRAANAGGLSVPMKSSVLERTGVGICALISLLAVVVALQTIRLDGVNLRGYWTLSVLLVVSLILSGLPAMLWKTRLRWAAEGLASIALAVAAVIGVFSIGLFFLPVLVLMTWVCIQHLRDLDNLRKLRGGTAARAGI
jgi:hypothetical protein